MDSQTSRGTSARSSKGASTGMVASIAHLVFLVSFSQRLQIVYDAGSSR